MKKIRFLDPAEREMRDAAHDYESQAAGLGEDSLSKVESRCHALIFLSSQAMFWPRTSIVRRASSSCSTSPLARPTPMFQ